jgi:hypothetical protein
MRMVKGPMELLKGHKLHQIMDKFEALCSRSVRNLIASFKHHQIIEYMFFTIWFSSPIDNG